MHSILRLALATGMCGSIVAIASPGAADTPVGDAVCAACHSEVASRFAGTVHGRLGEAGKKTPRDSADVPVARCEGCHGNGAAHVEAGGGPITDDATGWQTLAGPGGATREVETCLGCHRGGTRSHWSGSPHARADGRCSDCHEVHRAVSPEHLLSKRSEEAVCTSCHMLPRSQLRKNAHMPARSGAIGEGWMNCSSCHQPHGTPTRGLIAAQSVNDGCTSCHAEKRGPFLNEHAPVRESCLNCHDPHGSLNRGMLKVSGPRLCQSCHAATLHPSNARDSGSRMVIGRNCMQCHQKIHGSNHPSGFAFTR